MKLLLLLFSLLFCSSKIFAKDDLNFTYSYTPTPQTFNLELYELSKVFEERNFNRLSAYPSGNLPLVHADEVMYSDSHSGTIFIKMNLLAPENLRYKIIEGTGFYLYHTNNASIAFFDLSREEVAVLTSSLKQKTFSYHDVINIFIPTAEANSGIVCTNQTQNIFTNIENLNQKMSQSLLVKKIGECALNALNSAKEKASSSIDFSRGWWKIQLCFGLK